MKKNRSFLEPNQNQGTDCAINLVLHLLKFHWCTFAKMCIFDQYEQLIIILSQKIEEDYKSFSLRLSWIN